MTQVLLIGTFETKAVALARFRAALERHGLNVEPIDVSLGTKGETLSGPEKILQMEAQAAAAAEKLAARCDHCLAAVGLGGGTGAEIVLGALKKLPATYPKILVTTLPFDPRPMLADCAITLIPTLCDIEGMNDMLEQVFENAAAGIAGLANARRAERSGVRRVGVTTLGATGRAGAEVVRALDAVGCEGTVFHANGYGGAAFVRFVEEARPDGVIDLNVHELGRLRLAGAHVPMEARFTAAATLPRVVLPGALNFIGLGAPETVHATYLKRPHYRHTSQFTHVKLTESEMAQQASALADILAGSVAPCHVLIPMGGFSHEDRSGGAIEDEALRHIFADTLESRARGFTVARLSHHINTPETAQAAVSALLERMPHDRQDG